MESSGTTPSGGLRPADLPELARLFDEPGPFVSLYLSTPAAIENAAQRSELVWKNMRRELEEADAPESVLAAVDPLVPDAHLSGETLAVIANTNGVRHVDHVLEPPAADLWRVAPLPSVGPLIEWAQMGAPHLLVLVDRAGADIITVVRFQDADPEAVEDDNPSDPDLRKSKPGGWSQRRYQQRAENQWDRNAKQVADRVVELFDEVGARLVVAAGDERAMQLLREHLPERVLAFLAEVDGGRNADGGKDSLAAEATRMVATAVAEDTVALLEKFKEEKGQGDRAASGVARVLEALAAAQVDVLLLADDPDDRRTAYFGPEPNMVSLDEATVKGMGVDAPQEGRLADVLIRAAWGTGAAVRIVPKNALRNADGAAAILRFTTTPGS